MVSKLKAFWRDCAGTVSSDWVVLSAGAMALAVGLVVSVERGTTSLGPAISAEIEAALD